MSWVGKVCFWHQNQYHSSHNFYFLEIRDCERAVLCSLLAKISIEVSPGKNRGAVGFFPMQMGVFLLFCLFFFLFCFWFQVLQRRYPNLTLVTDHLLDVFIDLAGDKYQASEHSAAGSSHVPEAASESRSEHKKPNLEGRELSLRLAFFICLLEVS